jgi:hypothetical protein
MSETKIGAARTWVTLLLVLMGAGGTLLVLLGILDPDRLIRAVFVSSGTVVCAVAASTLVLSLWRYGESGDATQAIGQGDRTTALLGEIHQHTMLSDAAKRVLYRDRELQLLRTAIEDDIAGGQYNAGLTLCDDMANLFGNREEAETFRSRIVQSRQSHYEDEVRAAMAIFAQLTASHDWAGAHREAARIRRLYPDSHYVQELDQRIVMAREEHKRELEMRFLDAARREDVEQAMDLLRQLDRYLSQDEGASLREVAQGVISKHRENLGVQFKLAVNDHRWAEAAAIGQQITHEFPNSKMANEVHGMLDMIRTRASQAAVAAGGYG